jgi:hypothetical protein
MPTTDVAPPDTCAPAQLLALVAEIGALLERIRRALDDEIRAYPTPIPRCDAQFNFLYEQRSEVATALAEIAGLRGEAFAPAACRRVLEAFLRSTAQSDLPPQSALRARAAAWLGRDPGEWRAPPR